VIFSVESEGRREALGELLARIKIAPKRILRLDEAQDAGRYLISPFPASGGLLSRQPANP
ncbi:hypothetical protein MJN54_33370, partial [Salmonella enterica subsp. enterica serovar Kentucky]|nr:hypothetical protein [Salmonella enterica subsp. enterica serovar Kentucky]